MKVTEKGQVTIPKACETHSASEQVPTVEFERKQDTIVVRKVRNGPTRGQHLADRLRGRGDVRMSTDEIMALTRGK